jgi:hypothetical protein
LEEDIRARGVVIPIIVDADGRVIDGRLRQQIATRLGLPCPRFVVANLTEDERADWRRAINTYRRHLSQAQIRELIAWELIKEPGTSDRAIAGKIGTSHPTVSKVRARLEEGGKINHSAERTGRDGKQHPAAKPLVYARTSTDLHIARKALGKLGDKAPVGHVSKRMLNNAVFDMKMKLEAAKPVAQLPPCIEIHEAEFKKFTWRPYEGKVSLVLGDPPWLDEWSRYRRPYAELVARLLRPGGVLACYTGIYALDAFMDAFKTAGLRKQWVISCVNEGSAKVRVVGKGKLTVQSSWRPVVIFSKGECKCDRVLYDTIVTPSHEKTYHPWQQPLSESAKLLEVFSKPGEIIADPTMGSGTSAVAVALAGQGRRYVGVEIRADYVRTARARVAESRTR